MNSDEMKKAAHQNIDKAAQLYKEGKQKACSTQDCIEGYTEELVKKIKKQPLTSLLVAAGVGFLISTLLS